MPSLQYVLVLLSRIALASAVSVSTLNRTCNPANSKLDPLTHNFETDCDVTTWCSVAAASNFRPSNDTRSQATLSAQKVMNVAVQSGICVPKGCRRDEFPFGYPADAALPPMCPESQYCPDLGDQCQNLVAVGGTCELNRDDECLPPAPEIQTLISNPSNFNGSLCLACACTYGNITLAQTCTIDNTVFTGFAVDGTTYTDILTRDDCATALYCLPDSLVCTPQLSIGSRCATDRECASLNCAPSNECAPPPETPATPRPAVYVLVAFALAMSMAGTVASLYCLHRRQRERRRRERAEAWSEQREFRRSIMRIHAAVQMDHQGDLAGLAADEVHEGLIRRSPRCLDGDPSEKM